MFIDKNMSIKHTATTTQYFSSMNEYPSKYNPLSGQGIPTTPEFLSAPKNIDHISSMKQTQIFPPADKVGLKEQNIKSIDDRIGSIMKKYEKKDEPVQ